MATKGRSRPRKRHTQQSLFPTRQPGGGRKPKGQAGAPHKRRPAIDPRHPIHVVMRVVSAVGSMRRRAMYKAIRTASIVAALRERFRIVHISIQRNHLHMLVEADNKQALARGMQGFQISAAKHVNAEIKTGTGERRRGQVFADRYHPVVIESPRQARHVLAYVLNNWRKHREDRDDRSRTWAVDPFSTGVLFPDWKERVDEPMLWRVRDTYDPLVVYRPRTWLLRTGWKRHSLISTSEIPGAETSPGKFASS